MSTIDLIIKGGEIYDGSGSPPFYGDLGIDGGVIVASGNLSQKRARRVLNAEGQAVAPGFIDIHSHTDENILINPQADSKVRQGVTTEVVGNCGFSPAPLQGEFFEEFKRGAAEQYDLEVGWKSCRDYFNRLSLGGLGVNYIMLVGNANIRAAVVGYENRQASADELHAMKEILDNALLEGAWGLSSGLIYAPSCFSTEEELTHLAGVVAKYSGVYSTHMRGEGDSLLGAVEEALSIAQGSGVNLQVSHLKASGEKNWHKLDRAIALLEAAHQNGLQLGFDQYPYCASCTGLDSTLPSWLREGGRKSFLRKLKDDEIRRRVKMEMAGDNSPDWSKVVLSSFRRGRKSWMLGENIEQVSARLDQPPLDVVMDLIAEQDNNVAVICFSQAEENIVKVMKHHFSVFGSDAGARSLGGILSEDTPHPRAFGTYPRILGHYVRDQAVLGLEEAIKKMTLLPAKRLGIVNRGMLAGNYMADIVVFDPCSVKSKSTYEKPHQYPEGIKYVIINGEIVIDNGEHTGILPGMVLKRGCDGR